MTAYYTHVNGLPANQTRGTAATIRTELDAIAASFAILPSAPALASGLGNYVVDTGAANAYVITASSQVTAYADGQTFRVKAANTNTGASTLNVSGLGAKQILRPSGSVLAAGDILLGQIFEVSYSSTSDSFQLPISATGASPSAFSGTAGGVVDLLYGSSVASAATTNLNGTTGNFVHVTGTTSITAVTLTRGPRWVIFDGALTLTHHATNNNLPGGANITTAAGDRALYWSDGTTVYCVHYIRSGGVGLSGTLVLHVREEQASGTGAGSSTTGAFNTRTLNTVVANEITGASLATNQVTLPAGTYEFEGRCPFTGTTSQGAMAALYNVTDTTYVYGMSMKNTTSGIDSVSTVSGKFTITSAKVYELRQRFGAIATMGQPVSFGVNEVYSSLFIRKVA